MYPSTESTTLFVDWLAQQQLGRKRLLDTHLAATLWSAGGRRMMTANPHDFAILRGFELLAP
ncbi:MAG: hypothetical protein HY763_10630 [Planctomycetes bacterium]|nr:hypothetical protein [Planctomycetota bacterium]